MTAIQAMTRVVVGSTQRLCDEDGSESRGITPRRRIHINAGAPLFMGESMPHDSILGSSAAATAAAREWGLREHVAERHVTRRCVDAKPIPHSLHLTAKETPLGSPNVLASPRSDRSRKDRVMNLTG